MYTAHMDADIRWKQRFNSYCNALTVLERAAALAAERPLTELEEQGLIKSFEFTHELAWKLLKDYLEEKGFQALHGSRDATRIAFKENLIDDGEIWMTMIENRNRSTHTYEKKIADEIAENILTLYLDQFIKLRTAVRKVS